VYVNIDVLCGLLQSKVFESDNADNDFFSFTADFATR